MDFRLKVFVWVAQLGSFTKAAHQLHISQPAVSKHIQELESEYKVRLFDRSAQRIVLTPAGEVFLKCAESITKSYRALQLEMNLLTGNFSGVLRLGASTTIAQYVLPEIIAKFISAYPDVRFEMVTGNSDQIERALIDRKIDLGMVEGESHKKGLRYWRFMRDELVLVGSATENMPDEITVNDLSRLPLVLREAGSGTLEVFEMAIARSGLKPSDLNVLIHLGSTQSIKSFLENCPSAYAVVSVVALCAELSAGRLRVVDVVGLDLSREFSFVAEYGAHNDLVDRFVEFCSITKSYR